MFSYVSVSHRGGDSHVTITHDALDYPLAAAPLAMRPEDPPRQAPALYPSPENET